MNNHESADAYTLKTAFFPEKNESLLVFPLKKELISDVIDRVFPDSLFGDASEDSTQKKLDCISNQAKELSSEWDGLGKVDRFRAFQDVFNSFQSAFFDASEKKEIEKPGADA